MIRVAILKGRLNFRGGLEKYTLRLAQAFSQSGCEVTILTTDRPPNLPDIKTLSLMNTTKFSYLNICRFDLSCQKWLDANPQDVIFGMERNSSHTHYRAGSGVHKAYLKQRALTDGQFKQCLFKVNPLHRKLLNLEKRAFEDPQLKILFTNSAMVRDEIIENYGTKPDRIQVIHNGVEFHDWEEDFKDTFRVKKSSPHQFLFVGNGYKRKGLFFLLHGLSRLSSQEFHLTIVGKDKNTLYYQEIAKKLGLSHKISFKGPQLDLRPFLKLADSLVIPSIYDPFSNVTLEALAMGVFVVSSKYNGGCEVLLEKTGVIIQDLTSPKSVALALEKALARPKTPDSATFIRNSIKELDFSIQLGKMVEASLNK